MLVTFVAPIGAVLTKIFPIRILQMTGGMLAMLGIGLCSLATESWQVLVLFGIVAGKMLAAFYRINKLVVLSKPVYNV